MPRFRFFSKKRGEHRTTSDLASRAALGAFFGVLVVAGAAILASVVGRMTINEWRANHEFREARARITAKQVRETHEEESTKYRPEATFRYEVGGREYETTGYDATGVYFVDRAECERLLNAFDVGGEYPCWYDPAEPSRAVLVRGYTTVAWLVPLLPAAFIAVGFGGLVYLFLTWGKSAEHRAVMQQSTNLDFFDPHAVGRRYPTIPDEGDVTNSPGTTLAYRIPPASPGWDVLFLTLGSLGWNALVGWFLYRVLDDHFRSRGDYVLSLGLVPFVGVGAYLLYLSGKQWMVVSGVEPTLVEISEHPLRPGGRYDVFIRQAGRFHYRKFSVLLVCDEEATFRQGTNSRTHVERVVENEVYRRDAFTADRDEATTARFELRIPDRAMHSFQSPHNAVRWRLIVRGELNHWPDFERSFALLVYPAAGDGAAA